LLYFQIDLPDFDKLRREANFAPDEMRADMKRLGILPPRTYQERDIIIASTSMELLISFLPWGAMLMWYMLSFVSFCPSICLSQAKCKMAKHTLCLKK